MPYENGETPMLGDSVRDKRGRTATVTNVALDQGHLQGEDQVSVKWDDGGVGVGISLAREYTLISRQSRS